MSAGRMQYSKLNENATVADWPLRGLKPVAAISDQIRGVNRTGCRDIRERSGQPPPPVDWSTLAEVRNAPSADTCSAAKGRHGSGAWTPPDSFCQRLSTSENGRGSRPRCLIRQRSKSKRSWPKKGSPSNTIVGTPQ